MNINDQEKSQRERASLRVRKGTVWALLALFLFEIVLGLSYYFVISQVWLYAKFEWHPNGLKLLEACFLLLIVFVLMPKSSKKLSNILVWLLILLSYIPMLTLFALMDESRIFMYAVTGFWSMVCLLLRMPEIFVPSLRESQSRIIRYFIFICLSIIVLFSIYKYLGFSFRFNLAEVYDIRFYYVQLKIPLAGYLFNWLAYVVNPVFFATFIVRKKWVWAALIAVSQLLVFSGTGNKSFLFALPFVLVLIWIVTRRNPLAWMAIGLTGVVLIGILSYLLVDDIWIPGFLIRRALLVPAQLSFFYYDFFSGNEFVFLSDSRLGFLLDYPYHLAPGNLIAESYFGKPGMNAVTGVVGDAYMNFGFIGLALWSILLAVILKLIDTCSKRADFRVGVAAIAMPAIFLTNSSLLTCLLTHGLFLALTLLFLLPRMHLLSKEWS